MHSNVALLGPMSCSFISLEEMALSLMVTSDLVEELMLCAAFPAPSYKVYLSVVADRSAAQELYEFHSLGVLHFARMFIMPLLDFSGDLEWLEDRVYKAFMHAWDEYEGIHSLRLNVGELNLLLDQPAIFCRRSTFAHIVDGTLLRVLRSITFNSLARFIYVTGGLRHHMDSVAAAVNSGADLDNELQVSALLSELEDLLVPKAHLYLTDLPIWALQSCAQKWIDGQQQLYLDGSHVVF